MNQVNEESVEDPDENGLGNEDESSIVGPQNQRMNANNNNMKRSINAQQSLYATPAKRGTNVGGRFGED